MHTPGMMVESRLLRPTHSVSAECNIPTPSLIHLFAMSRDHRLQLWLRCGVLSHRIDADGERVVGERGEKGEDLLPFEVQGFNGNAVSATATACSKAVIEALSIRTYAKGHCK